MSDSPHASVVADGTRNPVLVDGRPVARALDDLGIARGRPVLIIIGWAAKFPESELGDEVSLLMRQIVIPTCRAAGALIITGGTASGIMSLVGRAAADDAASRPLGDSDRQVPLLGVAPARKLKGVHATPDADAVAPEPHHLIIASDGEEWGDESHTLVRAAECIAGEREVTVLAIGGDKGTAKEVVLAARRRWPVILIQTGQPGTSDRLIDDLTKVPLRKDPDSRPVMKPKAEPRLEAEAGRASNDDVADVVNAHATTLRAAVDADRIRAFGLDERHRIARDLAWKLSNDGLLKEGWSRFARLDKLAVSERRPVDALVRALLGVAIATVIATGAAVWSQNADWQHDVSRAVATALPLVAAILLAVIERRNRLGSWVERRGAAESIKREIYQYRGGTETYSDPEPKRSERLAAAFAAINEQVGDQCMDSAAGNWSPPFDESQVSSADTLCGPLTAPEYDSARAQHQLRYYTTSLSRLKKKALRLAVAIWSLAACSALALALSWKWEAWALTAVAVVTSVAAALVAWREFKQYDEEIETKESAAAQVQTARDRWLGKGYSEQRTPASLADYVSDVENALATENTVWSTRLSQAHRAFVQTRKG